MTNTEESPDPRPSLFHAIEKAGDVLNKVKPEHLAMESPCAEYDVKALGRHIVLVSVRLNQIGRGVSWGDLPNDLAITPEDYVTAFRKHSKDLVETWSDDDVYLRTRELPWGGVSGGEVLWPYVAEFVTHGWDLAVAIGAELEVDDEVAFGAFQAASHIPDDVRTGPDAPFGPVVEVDAGADVLTQLAGRMGRDVHRWSAPTA